MYRSLSPNDKPGNIIIKNASKKKFEYDVILNKWKESKIVTLTNQEKQILMLSMQGSTVEKNSQRAILS